jgi:L-alanine-DL-glutamate epimerase-like enolase superfamily enzyme
VTALVEAVRAAAYTVPTDAPEADGTLAWDSTTIIVVEVQAAGMTGLGWTYGSAACVRIVEDTLRSVVVGRPVLDIGATWSAMVAQLRNIGRPGVGGMALSAVDCALWDLKARVLGVPLHRLLGAVRDSVPLYGSGGFTNQDRDQLTAQLEGWLGEGMRHVKIKIAESWGGNEARDLDRVRLTRTVVGPQVEVFVDANGGYTPTQAVRVAGRLAEADVRWFEEPVSSEDIAGLRFVREHTAIEVAAGEYGHSLADLTRLCTGQAVGCLQIDVTRCGGITEFLRAAAVAAGHGLEVSGHCAPHLHAPVLAAIPNLRHLEWFHDHVRIERRMFDGVPEPRDGMLVLPTDRPGHGLARRPAEPGRRVA